MFVTVDDIRNYLLNLSMKIESIHELFSILSHVASDFADIYEFPSTRAISTSRVRLAEA